MEKTYVKYELKGLSEDEKADLKGVHLKHPYLPDDTLCGMAMSDNIPSAEYSVSEKGRVTCDACKTIIDYCKQA